MEPSSRALQLPDGLRGHFVELCSRQERDGFLASEVLATLERGFKGKLSDTLIGLFAWTPLILGPWKFLSPRGSLYETSSWGPGATMVVVATSLENDLSRLEIQRAQWNKPDPTVDACHDTFADGKAAHHVTRSAPLSTWLIDLGVKASTGSPTVQLRIGSDLDRALRKGCQVQHAVFGEGVVLRSAEEVYEIQFSDQVRKVHKRFLESVD